MSKSVDISHIVFVDLFRNIIDTTGTKVAKGNLMRIAMNSGNCIEPVTFPSVSAFLESMETGKSPLSKLEGMAIHVGQGLFGLEHCPFGQLLANYRDFYSSDPDGFTEVIEEFNADSKMSRQFKVGLGAGVGPFCIFHQPMRSQVGSKVTIDGQHIEIFQLACRSGNGEKAYAESLIEEFGCDMTLVEKVVDEYMCCYGIKFKDGSALC